MYYKSIVDDGKGGTGKKDVFLETRMIVLLIHSC